MKMNKAVSWILSLMLVFTMIPALGSVACAEERGVSPSISTDTGNIEKGDKVYMGVRNINGSIVPISWLVLGAANSKNLKVGDKSVDSSDARLLIAEKTQGATSFNSNGGNAWQESTAQTWCRDFLTGSDNGTDRFTAEEEAVPLSTSKSDGQYGDWGVSSLENERLFFLSAEEASDSNYFSNDDSRIAYRHDHDGAHDWWLRSPYSYGSNYAARVTPFGYVEVNGVSNEDGARPALNFNIDLKSVLFTSAAVGGKSPGAAGDGSLEPVSANPSGEWKLTVHDSSRDVFKASAATGAVLSQIEGYDSWSVPIACEVKSDDPYSVIPVPDDDDYVSVILADSEDNPLYYGSIAKASNSGTKNVTIPTGLAAGEYKLHVFYEEINGDKFTDYSSAFRTIDLTVNPRTYAVTVNNGNGSGEYAKDSEVTITAAAPEEGMQFKEWTGDVDKVTFTEGSKTTSTAKFKMPAEALTFEATYEAIPAPPEPTKIAIPTGRTLTYNGQSQAGVDTGTGYSLSGMTSATNAGAYQATATLDEGYIWDDETSEPKTISWKIEKATVNVTAPAGKTFTYNGKAQTGVASGANYTLSGTVKATNAGSYTAKAALKINDNYTYRWPDGTTAAKTIKWTINKAANTLKIKAKTATVKGSTKGKKGTLKKTKKLAVTKVIKFTSKGQGAKTYVKKSGNKKIIIAKKTGKVTVKKGLKKGTYKVKVKVKAAGNANYKASKVKTVTFKVIVK